MFASSNAADTQSQNVPIDDDEVYEESETFTIRIGDLTPNADGCSTTGTTSMATVTITDNDCECLFVCSCLLLCHGKLDINSRNPLSTR